VLRKPIPAGQVPLPGIPPTPWDKVQPFTQPKFQGKAPSAQQKSRFGPIRRRPMMELIPFMGRRNKKTKKHLDKLPSAMLKGLNESSFISRSFFNRYLTY